MTFFDKTLQKKFLTSLFKWYRRFGRHDMPWRKTKDPYAILVSEYMLQQTTVATVKPYYDRFLKKFPTLKSLAQADLNDVLALWSGLGYYARARNLWAAARAVWGKKKGRIPKDQNELKKLPGVGPYISGAVASIAFDQPAVVLDGNIIRVLMRVLAIEDEPKLKAVQTILQRTSMELGETSKKLKKTAALKKWSGPRHLSLALMDLGATWCSPRGPQCEKCPVGDVCLAKRYKRQQWIPQTGEVLERPTVRWLSGVVESGGKWLMGQRPHNGLFGGLWEFVGTEAPKAEEPVPHLEGFIHKEVDLKVRVYESIPAFEHQLTHRILVIRPFLAILEGGKPNPRLPAKGSQYEGFKWIRPADISRMGVSSVTQRIINTLTTKLK
jgi:A/G-specific adenine glycosylase